MAVCNKCDVPLEVDVNYHASFLRKKWYICTGCNDTYNKGRMYVDGKYIPKSHPLYKPGNYKTFNAAAFSSLENYTSTKSGYVYVITNPAWSDWVKVGMAIDAEDRLASYQTSSPLRDYELQYSVYCRDRRKSERKAHKLATELATDRKGEWFKLSVETAVECISDLLK